MDRRQILDAIIKTAETFDTDETAEPGSSLIDDLGLESLEIHEMLAKLEAIFQIRIPEKVLMRVDTIEDLAEEVCKIKGID